MELNFAPAQKGGLERLLASLADLEPIRMRFGLSLATFERNCSYTDSLLEAQQKLPRVR